jgi:hypothetical protein
VRNGLVLDEGMTKRELIAAMLLQGMYSNPESSSIGVHAASQQAILAADALIYQLAELEPQA